MAPIHPWNFQVRRDFQDKIALYNRQNNAPPQDIYVFILRTCEYVFLQRESEFELGIILDCLSKLIEA